MIKKLKMLVGLSAVATLIAAAPAQAIVREGTGVDATGDSAGGANRDVIAASFKYDSNGQAVVSATMAAPIDATNADAFASFNIATAGAAGACSGASISIFGFFSSTEASVTVTGLSGIGSATKVISGARISWVFSASQIANRDYTCSTAVVTSRTGASPEFRDPVEPNLFAVGFGPDTDGDTIVDNVDQCPTQAGVAPGGCPAPVAAPTPAPAPAPTPSPAETTPEVTADCESLKLKGKSLEKAKSAIKKAGCRLGAVTKPKKPKKGFKLVVTKQKVVGVEKTKVNLTLGFKKA